MNGYKLDLVVKFLEVRMIQAQEDIFSLSIMIPLQ